MDPGAGAHYSARTAEEVFRDFRGRRAGMIKALTTGICHPPLAPFCSGFRLPVWPLRRC